MVEPALKREIVDYVLSLQLLSERRNCKLIGISRRTYRYHSVKDDRMVIETLTKLLSFIRDMVFGNYTTPYAGMVVYGITNVFTGYIVA